VIALFGPTICVSFAIRSGETTERGARTDEIVMAALYHILAARSAKVVTGFAFDRALID
jgi:hypothetical protein